MRLTPPVCLLAISLSAQAAEYGKLPLSFEVNQGQTDPRVQFLSRGRERTFFVTSMEAVLRLPRAVVRIELLGANPASKAQGEALAVTRSNYFIGNDPAKWRTNVPNYGRVRFSEVYPGIDLLYYGNDGQLEYDWIVKPGADPSRIRMRFDGVQKMRVDANGDLVLETTSGELRQKAPLVYQDSGRKVAGRYRIRRHEATFELGRYDRSDRLIIDPVLVYATYLGGSANDYGTAIAADSSGNAYVTGTTQSTDFPTSHPFQGTNNEGSSPGGSTGDAFVSKISADGSTLIYSTFLGGTGFDQGNGIAVDAAGDAYVAGETTSTDFPLANAFQSSNQNSSGAAFVTKLNPSGSALVFSTYLGGEGGGDLATAIALDSSGNAYITGADSSSGNFPLVNPIEGYNAKDASTGAFVTKLSADGSALVYSTFIGGYNGQNFANGIAVDASGAAYVAGETMAPDFPTVNPIQAANNGDNAFVLKISPAGSALAYATVLGGSLKSAAYAIAVDTAGNAYMTGTSRASDFPVTANPYETSPAGGAAIVAKISPSGSSLVYSTYLGNADDNGYGIAVDASGHAWVTGNGHVPSINALPFAQFSTGFACEFSADGSALLFSSKLWVTGELAGGITLDASGNAYVTGSVEPNGLAAPSGFQSTFGGGQEDAVVVKIGAGGGTGTPQIAANGIVNGASFQPGLVPGSWATIRGTNLAASAGTWDIVNGVLPTSVNGVSVTVGGQPAYVYFVNTGQINFIVPEIAAGSQQVVVTNSAGVSSPVTATVNQFGPAFFEWPASQVVATTQSFAYVANSGTFPAVTTTPAKPGETIILWGTGFGPTSPAQPQGVETPSTTTYSTETLPTVTINDVPATVYGTALAPGFAGLYQVAIQVPASLGDGQWPVVATIGGVSSPSGMVLAVEQ